MWEPEFLEHVIILIKYKRKIGDLLKMGVLDKFLDIMKLSDDDDYDDDDFFDDDYDDDYDEKPAKKSFFGRNKKDHDFDEDPDDLDDLNDLDDLDYLDDDDDIEFLDEDE